MDRSDGDETKKAAGGSLKAAITFMTVAKWCGRASMLVTFSLPLTLGCFNKTSNTSAIIGVPCRLLY